MPREGKEAQRKKTRRKNMRFGAEKYCLKVHLTEGRGFGVHTGHMLCYVKRLHKCSCQ